MGGVCRWCGVFVKGDNALSNHEEIHRGLDSLGGNLNSAVTNPSLIPGSEQETTVLRESPRTDIAAKAYQCDRCDKIFGHKKSLTRHIKAKHKNHMSECSKCGKLFKYVSDKSRHQKSCSGITDPVCRTCGKRCSTVHGLKRHEQWHGKQPNATTTKRKRTSRESTQPGPAAKRSRPTANTAQKFRCRRCTECFNNRRDLYMHGMRQHFQVGGALQRPPWDERHAPWHQEGGDVRLRDVYEANAGLILEPHRRGPVWSVYNFPLDNNVDVDLLMRHAEEIYRHEQRAFRLNLVFGTILQHRETGEYRYFVPYNNNGIFERPLYVSRRTDLERLRLRLRHRDILTDLLRNRPDTKWIPVLVTNVHYTVFSTFYPLGNGHLPDYLLNKDSIYPIVKSQQTGKPYKDQLCVFRCLALHRGHEIRCIDGPAKEYYKEWKNHYHLSFNGVTFEDFPAFENVFNVNLEVYSLQEDGFAHSVYQSRGQRDSTMYLNLYENHLSYIRDFNLYAHKYRCKTCDRHFKHSRDLSRHQRSCANKTKYVYPGGFYQSRDTIFEELDQYGIHIPHDQRTFPWFVCYDFEAILQQVNDRPTEFLHWTQKHIPISVSICSNVEGYQEPVCIVEPDQERLVQKMIEVMTQIANAVYELAEEKWGWVLEEINTKLEEEIQNEKLHTEQEQEEKPEAEEEYKPSHPLKTLYGYIQGYMSQLPVIGFNSAKYDLNLVKRSIAKALNMHQTGLQRSFVVKKNNSYACIATDDLKFLDMSQFLAAGSSYASFLQAYHVEAKKGFFPYDWFNDVSKLDVNSLPPQEAFYSTLKGANISREEYEHCQKVWSDSHMSTFKDFLVWYNNLDVGQFVEAVLRFQTFYFEKGIDVFKSAISVPGIARQLLFKSAKQQKANFALFDRDNADLHQTIKQNIIGGPSIIFTRQHIAKQTLIRGGKPCGSILGFDANALYLEAIGKPMPVGPFIRRRSKNDFRPEVRDKFMSAYYWMDWLIHSRGLNIQHKLNAGKEVRIGKYPVDGFCPTTKPGDKPTVYQFHGCYFHGHLCDVTKNIKDKEWWEKREEKNQKTQEITDYLNARSCEVVEMRECEFRRYCLDNPDIEYFIDSKRPGFFQRRKGKLTENQILEGVVKGELFGMVEVDIEVPDQWPGYYQDPRMSPYDYFREMSPLFCTSDIPYEAIGEHMQSHVESYNLSIESRRLLVGGMKGKQLLIATPLLQWYLNHGMTVTKIYQVVEFRQQRCFQDFVKEVSEARRNGDRDPNTAIIADTMKVIGNSGYGSLIMDKTRHRNVEYVQGENETSLKINDPRFRKLDCLDAEEQYYEMEMAKRVIKLDLPIQLGYIILQYAKLRMLEFYYDFMDVYVDRADFEYCEMDTDSAYMAISGSNLQEVIKPSMREKYLQGLNGFCSEADVEADAEFHWFPRTCCSDHAKYDKRTPGLFKLEYQGDEMIGLCSKTYIVGKQKVLYPSSTEITAYHLSRRSRNLKKKRCPYKPRIKKEFKFSSKGISKRALKAPISMYRRVLKTGKAESGKNRGFRVNDNTIYTYDQERKGFSYFYCKRKVLNDGIHTVPLDITLCPVAKPGVDDQELIDILEELMEEHE